MKRIIPIILLFLYLITWIKPYSPYIEYIINKDYIAQNLCENKNKPKMQCNGKCYLIKQIEKVSEEEHTPFTLPDIETKETIFYVDTEAWKLTQQEIIVNKQKASLTKSISNNFQEIPTPPPKHPHC